MRYMVVTCSTENNRIVNEGIFDTLVDAQAELKSQRDYVIEEYDRCCDIIPHGEDDGMNFDLELSGFGYEVYGQIFEI